MRRTAWLVNTSRGPIVDEAALVEALRRRVIAGAALDAYDEEPLPADHPLRRLENTVLTPHLGYVTTETYRVFYAGLVEAVRAWLDGRSEASRRPARQVSCGPARRPPPHPIIGPEPQFY